MYRYDDQRGIYLPPHVRNKSGYSQVGGGYRKAALSNFFAKSRSPSEDINDCNDTIRQRARTLHMSSPLAVSGVETFISHVIGTGLKLRSRIAQEFLGMSQQKATDWQSRVEFEWNLWAEDARSCDAIGMNNHYKQQQINLRTLSVSGDCTALFQTRESSRMRPYALRVRLLEPDRISTPEQYARSSWGGRTEGENGGKKIYDGVEVDKDGYVTAIHVCNTYGCDFSQERKWVRVEAESGVECLPELLNFTMTMCSQRTDQYRGVSMMAPVIESLLQLRRYNDSTETAAAVQAYLAFFLRTIGTDGVDMGAVDPVLPDLYEMGAAQAGILPSGYTIDTLNTTQPNSNYKDFVDSHAEQIGAALRTPGEVIRKVFNSSYSASQAAIQEYYRECEMLRYDVVNGFCQPTYVRWLAEAVARGRIEAPGFFTDPVRRRAFCLTRWVGPPRPVIDPVKEQKAIAMAIKNCSTTREDAVQKYDGGDFRAIVAQLAREEELMRSYKLSGMEATDGT